MGFKNLTGTGSTLINPDHSCGDAWFIDMRDSRYKHYQRKSNAATEDKPDLDGGLLGPSWGGLRVQNRLSNASDEISRRLEKIEKTQAVLMELFDCGDRVIMREVDNVLGRSGPGGQGSAARVAVGKLHKVC